ncbi:SDR family oxidoreductase [Chitinophaga sancti]|uniref:Nucleoside-diphosphate-sugar epimerase n=1 Tax=Chitinophaga sancti TaxID=1004 RepID=A0A1K1NHT8_9BACT|nr:SDR family oxidoreductase [Chitinophaga sancti]WQD63213.1 SDR family oxidoreductase [Chitinophaga sancti]WQG91161.1 SDR family oxidoreductase [Chitinophaga sancti]SFW34884.1 Nucleoside-diphosphate-sugar epimerase [Chitinophaga sancti]
MEQHDYTKNKSISVLGCGWLGLPLAGLFVQQGYRVKGSVTSEEKLGSLFEKGILPYQLRISDQEIDCSDLAGFLDSDILIINFPPGRRPDITSYHAAQIALLIQAIETSPVQHVLFISSTSVYPDLNREITEKDMVPPTKGSGQALILAENLLLSQTKFTTTILRLGGLIGYDRMPARFLAGKKDVENGDAPINVIHQDDCLGLISALIEQEVWEDIFHAAADEHPTRKEYYTLAAEKAGLEPPTFAEGKPLRFKIINSDKIKHRLHYTFKHPNPLALL